MKFTVQPQPLTRLVEILGEGLPRGEQQEPQVRLVACQGRVCVEIEQMVAEMEAVIQEEGECSFSCQNFLRPLRAYGDAANLTIQADAQGLHLGEAAIPVSRFRARAIPPLKFQVFLATHLDSVPPVSEALTEFDEAA
jgi:hypothetical protein